MTPALAQTLFVVGVLAMPISVGAIATVYLVQYRMASKVPVPVLVGTHFVAVSVIIVAYGLLCWAFFRPGWWQYPGWSVFAVGSGVFWYAVRCHPTCLVPDDQRGLVRAGPYSRIRHPIYAGGLLGALGLVGVAPAWQMAVVWLDLAICLGLLGWIEERELCERIASYRVYRAQTRLLVPGVL